MEMYDFHKDNCSKLYDAIGGKYCTIYETKVDENKKYFYTDYVNIAENKFMLYPTESKSREVVILIGDLVLKITDTVGESNKSNINELLDYLYSILPHNISRQVKYPPGYIILGFNFKIFNVIKSYLL